MAPDGRFDRSWRKVDRSYWPATSMPEEFSATTPSHKFSRHPELEDHDLIEWGLEQSANTKGAKATIDVLQCCGDVVGKCRGLLGVVNV